MALEEMPIEDRPHLGLTLAQHGAALGMVASLYVGGRLGDRDGPRRSYVLGMLVFAVSSVAFALAPHSAVMAVAAVGQGVGGALVLSQTFSTVTDVLTPGRRAAALPWFAALAGLGTAVAPFGLWFLSALAPDVVESRDEWRVSFLVPALATGVMAVLGVPVGVTPLSRLAGRLVRPSSPDEPALAAPGPSRR